MSKLQDLETAPKAEWLFLKLWNGQCLIGIYDHGMWMVQEIRYERTPKGIIPYLAIGQIEDPKLIAGWAPLIEPTYKSEDGESPPQEPVNILS